MRELTLILTDLYLEQDPADSAQWPRLPALETVLARGSAIESRDWRKWVWRRIGLPEVARIPIATFARHARTPLSASEPAGQWWLAHAIHLAPGVDRVYLAESPVLSGEEWRELEGGFSAAFSAAGFRLMDGQVGRAFLLSTTELDSDTIDPARVRGRDILSALPTGPGAPALKRLMTEIQMWLHQHPVNIARQDRAAGMVNGLWIWGGGLWPVEASAAALPVLRSDDGFLCGLWKWAGGVGERVPQSFQAIELARDDAMIVALGSAPAVGESPAQALKKLEQDWMRPALASLKRGRIARLQLHVNDRLISLTRSDSWRWWRRRRPWFAGLT